MTKKKIKAPVKITNVDSITGEPTLGDVYDCVTRLIEEYGPDAEVEFDSGYNSICETIITFKEREETDEEYKHRVKKERKKMEKDRQEYERLKKVFEGEE
jgi:hypothetical protein